MPRGDASKKPKRTSKRVACKKCKGTGFVNLTKGIRYRGHLLMGGVSVRCDHKNQETK